MCRGNEQNIYSRWARFVSWKTFAGTWDLVKAHRPGQFRGGFSWFYRGNFLSGRVTSARKLAAAAAVDVARKSKIRSSDEGRPRNGQPSGCWGGRSVRASRRRRRGRSPRRWPRDRRLRVACFPLCTAGAAHRTERFLFARNLSSGDLLAFPRPPVLATATTLRAGC